MPVYFYLIFFGIGLTLAAMGSDSGKAIITGYLLAIFGGLALAAFKISDGSDYVAIITGLILTAPIGFGSLWLLMKIVDASTPAIEYLETKSFRKTGTITSVIDETKTGKVTLDVLIEGVSEFEATSKEHMPVGTRVVVNGLKRRRMLVQVLRESKGM